MTGGPDARPLGWGVLGATSYVAQQAILPALAASAGARLVAVASESRGGGELARHGAEHVHASYEALLADPDVEIVYVPLPNAFHRPWVERAARAGKHVLCEKPLGVTAAEGEAMAAACDRAGVTLLEAYVSPHHPRAAAVEALVRSGRLGDLRFARATFTGTLRRGQDDRQWRWRPEMGGGALLDLGVYCVAPLLRLIGREPPRLSAAAHVTPGGVDASLSGWLDFGDGLCASLECSFETPDRQELELVGSEGALLVDRAHTPGVADGGFVLRSGQGRVEWIEAARDDPYRRMVEQAHAVLRAGAPPVWPVAESIRVLRILDRLRAAACPGAPA